MSEKYIDGVLRSESHQFHCDTTCETRLLHAALGLTTEAGEFADTIKKSIFYGKKIDIVNLKEELGDLCWYIAVAIDVLGSSFEEIQTLNIAKLRARYPEKFTENEALNRNLSKEQKALGGV